MEVTASAPCKAILFGEHAVVYGKPAIAVAVDRRARVTIREGSGNNISVKIPELDIHGFINPDNGLITHSVRGEDGILEYIRSALFKANLCHELEIEVSLEVPIGSGLGSSAAITVATLAAATRHQQLEPSLEDLALMAHQVEFEVQGAASPLDTAVSTFGGIIYLSSQKEIVPLEPVMKIPLVVGCTSQQGHTGRLIEGVRRLREAYPHILDPILESMENIVHEAREALLRGEEKRIGELMNINQGLLDALGVNTWDLSRLVYLARSAGALGSKITGAGGGGSMIAYCPGRTNEVLKTLKKVEDAFEVGISSKGVIWK
jgi:mevalonate kinase